MEFKTFTAFVGLTLDIEVPDKFELDPNSGASWHIKCPFKPTISID
jgi:hypothetical protein